MTKVSRNKVINVDGAPGITMEGGKGITGKSGGMFFITDAITNLDQYYSVFDMWSQDISTRPMYIDKKNYCKYATPQKDDYVLTHMHDFTYVYIIVVSISKEDLYERESLDKYVNAGEISKEYADKIFAYYSDNALEDCCLVKEVSILNTANALSGNNALNIEVSVRSDEVMYDGYNGNIDTDGKAFITKKTVPYLTFSVKTENPESLNKIKIEAEFIKNNRNVGEMSSLYPALWSNPEDETVINCNYINGYLNNYRYDMNFDNEDLGNFSVILKDWNVQVTTNIFDTTVRLPENIIDENNYIVFIYAYFDNGKFISKNYIGDFDAYSVFTEN
jgi:hypothetical protein